MSKTEIIAELPRLTASELAEVQAKLDELAGESWSDQAELSESDKAGLETAIKEYQTNPDAGSTLDEGKSRAQAKLRA